MPYKNLYSVKPELKAKLNDYDFDNKGLVDLHKLGVHFHDPKFLPTQMKATQYASYCAKGLTPPIALPSFIREGTQERIVDFLNDNYFKMEYGGVQYLGNEPNLRPVEDWDRAKVRVCICRASEYYVVDGSFGPFLINNFIQSFTDDFFIDFAYAPPRGDLEKFVANDLPPWFGTTTKRPLTDFDIVLISNSYMIERANIAFLMAKSGLPLRLWEREDESLPYNSPIVGLVGVGSTSSESMFADNPVKGLAQDALFDYALIGEGEMLDLKFFQEYLNTVKRRGGDKRAFRNALTNEMHKGVYDPTKVLWTYADKINKKVDHQGKILDEQTFIGGGRITGCYLVDEETKTKHCILGPESEEFSTLYDLENKFRNVRETGKPGSHYLRNPENTQNTLTASE